jgi:hypothetical protein
MAKTEVAHDKPVVYCSIRLLCHRSRAIASCFTGEAMIKALTVILVAPFLLLACAVLLLINAAVNPMPG